jgi:hypothetical protein
MLRIAFEQALAFQKRPARPAMRAATAVSSALAALSPTGTKAYRRDLIDARSLLTELQT